MTDDDREQATPGPEEPVESGGTPEEPVEPETPAPETATEPAPAPPPPPRRFVRRTDDKVIAGVCSGLGAYTGTDPVIWRIGFVVLALVSAGIGVVGYLIAWLVTPEAESGEAVAPPPADPNHARRWLGIGAIALGAIIILQRVWGIHGSVFWGLLLIGVGVALWGRELSGGSERPRPVPPPPPVGPSADAAPSTPPVPPVPPGPPVPPVPPGPPRAGAPAASPVPTTSPSRREPSVLGRVVVGAAALAVGIAMLLDDLEVIAITARMMITILLLIVAAGLLLGTRWGRARWLIAPGLLLSIALVATAFVPVSLRGGYGQIAWRPASLTELRPSYEWSAGQTVLDLSRIDLAGRTRRVAVTQGFGEMLVLVPPSGTVTVHARVRGGELRLFGAHNQGWRVSNTSTRSDAPRTGRLRIDAALGFGNVVVREGQPLDDLRGSDDTGLEVETDRGEARIRIGTGGRR